MYYYVNIVYNCSLSIDLRLVLSLDLRLDLRQIFKKLYELALFNNPFLSYY